MSGLVLSLFPGIGLLDMAFEQEGFCVVRGPDVLWGGDIRRFHPPAGRFDGVIGGPPCQCFSSLAHLNRSRGIEPSFGNLIPEFERCVIESRPSWFIMEQVPQAPVPEVDGYVVRPHRVCDREVGGVTSRVRTISFGTPQGHWLQFPLCLLPSDDKPELAVNGSARRISVGGTIRRNDHGRETEPGYSARLTVPEMARLQGLPEDAMDHLPFTASGKRKMIGNGVPLPMGRAIARAVKEAITKGAA